MRMKNILANERLENSLNELYSFFKKHNIKKLENCSKKELLNSKKLDLSSKGLKYIPKEIAILKNLEILDICSNDIKEIPESIYELNNLKYIDMSVNKIKHIAETISNLKKLEEADISNNNFKEFLFIPARC